MFGLLRPSGGCGGACSKRATYATAYCGLCAGIGERHGLLPRATLSYDGVFVVLLADALVEEAATPGRCRCPALPIVHRPTMAASSTAVRFATAVHMLLVDQWVADGAMEGKLALRLARKITSPHAERAWTELRSMGVDVEDLRGFEAKQAAVEDTDPDPERAAAPTAWALSRLFSGVGALPGVGADPADLAALGGAVGRAIYLVDALEDVGKDERNGDFNPCLDEKGMRAACALLRADLATVRETFERIPWRRHRDVLADILLHSFSARARRSMELARATLPSGSQRFVRAFLAFGALLWGWLCAVPRAFAALAPHHDAAADAASSKPIEMPKIEVTPGTSPTSTTAPLPTLPPPAPTSTGTSSTPTPSAPSFSGGCPCTECWKDTKDCCDCSDKCCKCCDGCMKGDTSACGCGDCCKCCDCCK